jgi:hypothetical protein
MSKGKYNNKPVFDAKTALTVKISKADIVGSKPGNPDNCAAAVALVRQEPIMAAHVYRSRVFVEFKDKVIRYVTPGRLRQETISFDRGTPGKFMEGDYKILPPPDSQVLGIEHRSGRVGGKIKTAVDRHEVQGARRIAKGLFFKARKKVK